MIVRTLALGAALMLMGCTYPTTTVKTVESKPQLAIANASPSSVLLINGVPVGSAAAYDGKKSTLQMDRGTHRIEVQDQGRTIYSQTIYLGDDLTKTITMPN
jgi:PBP1b-binding outer membrane lipoprotein LpoB